MKPFFMGKNMLQIVVVPLSDGYHAVAYQSAECQHLIQKFVSRALAESLAYKMQCDRLRLSCVEVNHGR